MFDFYFKFFITGIIRLFFVFLFLDCSMVFPCSLQAGYLMPSNYDLVKMTDAIILARVVSFSVGPPIVINQYEIVRNNRVFFDVEEVLKGQFEGIKFDDIGTNDFVDYNLANGFSNSRPIMAGKCNASSYRIGFRYLLFLNKEKEVWHISGPPYSRINEEVDGVFSPWVETVRDYVEISSSENYDIEKDKLKKLKMSESIRNSGYSMDLIKDIDNHFSTPSSEKSISDLIDIYMKSKSDEIKRGVLWAISKKEDNQGEEVFLFMVDSLKMDFFNDDYNPQALYFERLQDGNSINLLADVYLELDPVKNWRTRRIILNTMSRLCDDRCRVLIPQIQKQSSNVEQRDFSKFFEMYRK